MQKPSEQTEQLLKNYCLILQQTYQAKSEAEVKQAEEQLLQASKNDPNFLENLIYLLRTPQHDQVDKQMKQAISNYIQHFTRVILAYSTISGDQMKQIGLQLLEAVLDANIIKTHKFFINNAINSFLQLDQDNSFKIIMYDRIQEKIKEDRKENYVGCFLAYQPLINSVRNQELIEKLSQNLLEILTESGTQLMKLLSNHTQILQANLNEENLAEFKEINDILETCIETINCFILKLIDNSNEKLRQLFITHIYNNNKLAMLYSNISQYIFTNKNQFPNCGISTTGVAIIDDSINQLKKMIFKSYTKMNNFSFENRGKLKIRSCVFYKMITNVLPICLNTVYQFCFLFQEKLNIALENEQMSKLLVENLNFIKVCMGQQDFYHLFAENKNTLLLNVILPLMRTTPSEIDDFQDNPQQFVNLALDTCDKQLSDTHKTAASQLLEILCDNIDGCTTYVGAVTLSTIRYSLNQIYYPQQTQNEDYAQLSQQYPSLADQWNSLFLRHSSPEIRIETSLVALSVMSYLTQKRPDILQEIENLFQENEKFFFVLKENNYRLIQARLCLFLGYYIDSIFVKKNQQEFLKRCTDFLIECTQLSEQPSISQQAIDSLVNVYDDEDFGVKFQNSIIPSFATLIQLIPTCQCNQFLDLISSIISNYSNTLIQDHQLILKCISQLVERVNTEFKLIQNTQKDNQLTINKCWNIIRSIAENDDYIPTLANEIENILEPLLIAIQHPDKIEFDDDIILTISSFLKKTQSVTRMTAELIPYFPGVLQKQKFVFGHMFSCLNYLIEYGHKYFNINNQQSIDNLKLVLQLSVQSLLHEGNDVSEADNAEGATIIQLVLQNYYDLLNEQTLVDIFQAALQRLKSEKKMENNFFRGRVLGIFLSAFNANLQRTVGLLQDQLDQIFSLLLEKSSHYTTNYDIKVFIMGISVFLNHLTEISQNQTLAQFVPSMLEYLVTLLKKQQSVEQKDKNKNSYQQDDDDDDDDEDDEMENYYSMADDFMQDKINLDYLVNDKVMSIDEFEIFKSTIRNLKNNNNQQLFDIVSKFPEEQQSFFKEVLSIQRVSIDGEKQIARKIVKRVKRNQN
ncbi:Armadillo-type fold [Pseudocohnilembus persalinus]|uniref:Armadillo-type fold n=1 Tax=Pseudocohnilembus persalinus TaxID=266149 RepID=A0A0V0QNZ6_PSEPJ|nr:Armadillo-type fold [Pseudocohnilembus persalinus]|eukprot:KRX04002.1 Armadillo-type fold [Pseudocohnilembus persalinus]